MVLQPVISETDDNFAEYDRKSARVLANVLTASKNKLDEWRVVGPPGTGKTTWLCRQATNAVEAWCRETGGVPEECHDVLMSSLTKAAATELHSRGLPIPKMCIATLHAHAYRSMGNPTIANTKKPLEAWHETTGGKRWNVPAMGSAGKEQSGYEKDAGRLANRGAVLHADYLEHRARLIPYKDWHAELKDFGGAWDEWKAEHGAHDFVDIVDHCYHVVDTAPGSPSVIFVDEAQDHDAAELRLIRKWGTASDRLILVGDPDQCLYEFRGSDPKSLSAAGVPDDRRIVLSQSYRVPRAVHGTAQRIIERVSERDDVEYQPRDAEGTVSHIDLSFNDDPHEIVSMVRHSLVAKGREVMLLASCHYLLKPMLHALRVAGVPYHNPFALDNGALNPLKPSVGRSSASRILDYLRPIESVYGDHSRMWTFDEMLGWTETVAVGGLLRKGKKTEIKKRADKTPVAKVTRQDLDDWFLDRDGLLKDISSNPIRWFKSRLTSTWQRKMRYPLEIAERNDPLALGRRPQVIVGTIHSVKGGESDVVILSPDLSQAEADGDRDSVYRKFYVAATRAKNTLIIAAPGHRSESLVIR